MGAPIDPELTADAEEGGDVGPLGAACRHIVAPPLQENPAALLMPLRRPAAAPQRRLAARSRGCAGCSRQVGDGRHDSPEVAGH